MMPYKNSLLILICKTICLFSSLGNQLIILNVTSCVMLIPDVLHGRIKIKMKKRIDRAIIYI